MTEGTTLYCGDVCNHTGPHRYPPPIISAERVRMALGTHCPHGLDLRVHPRCYLCKPLESNSVGACLCYGNWLGVIPPACPVHNPPVVTFVAPNTTGRDVIDRPDGHTLLQWHAEWTAWRVGELLRGAEPHAERAIALVETGRTTTPAYEPKPSRLGIAGVDALLWTEWRSAR